MQEETSECDLIFLDEEIYRLLDSTAVVPYSALPLERSQIICFAGEVEALTGYTTDEILADSQLWINMIHPADRQRVLAAYSKCKSRGIPFEIEYRIIHKGGSVHRVIDEGESISNEKGQISQIEGIITEVGRQGRAQDLQFSKVQKAGNTGSI